MPASSQPGSGRNEPRTFAEAVAEFTDSSHQPADAVADLTSASDLLRVEYELNGDTLDRVRAAGMALQALIVGADQPFPRLATTSGLADEALTAAASYYERTDRPFPSLAAASGSRRTTAMARTTHRAFNITAATAARIATIATRNGTIPSALAEEALAASATHYENQLNDGREFPAVSLLPPGPRTGQTTG